VAAFPDLLRRDRQRRGFTIGQVAWRLGVKPQEYRELEAGTRSPDFETWDRICKLYGWPQTFEGTAG
jgi:transcriptional regulator with XRE-family HTH domain